MAEKKRKSTESSKTPAKKKKVEQTKKTPSSAKKAKTPTPKKVTSSKVKKPDTKSKDKKTPSKSPSKPSKTAKTPAKTSAKAVKTPQKGSKSTKTPTKNVVAKSTSKDIKKSKLAAKSITRAKLDKAKVNKAKVKNMKAKLDKAKALKAKAAAVKAKLKTTKNAAKPRAVLKATVKPKARATANVAPKKKVSTPVKKPEPTKTKIVQKPEEKKKNTPKHKAPEKKGTTKTPTVSAKKRKNTDTDDDAPRKRRMITPNKNFADFELDVPAKRTITPNKKYADYETDTSPKKVSELRAFIQDKKNSPETPPIPDKPEKLKPTTATKKATKDTKESPAREIKVFKPSDMKPAEKLMKKLQKKLEKEAKSASTPKSSENREKAKIKITKVVTYNKPMSSDEKEMRAIKSTPKAKALALQKIKTTSVSVKTPKQPVVKSNTTKVGKAMPKATPKQGKAPEKQPPKPKKIKELRREERPIQAKFTGQKNIQMKDDNEKVQCWITGISVFPSGEIIMVDMANKKIKLFSKDFEPLSQVKLDTIPQDISISPVNVSDAYFTKPFSKEGIQKTCMSDGILSLKESFWTNGTNRGITCTKAGILTSVQDGRYHDLDINHFKIDLLDYEGNVLQSVSTDSNGFRLFKLPLYFTVDSTGKQMIVADCIKHFSYVVSVDMSGKIRFKYEGINNNLVTPRGLTIDDEDNIYVTEWERHNVYILSQTGKRLQVLFTHQELVELGIDGLLKPYQLCFYKHADNKKLIVSQEGCNTIKVFDMYKKGPEAIAAEIAAAKVLAEQRALQNGDAGSPTKKSATPKKNNVETKTNVATEAPKPFIAEKLVKSTEVKEQVVEKEEDPSAGQQPDKLQAATNIEESKDEQVAPSEAVQDTIESKEVEENETSPPTLQPEFDNGFESTESKPEEIPTVQDANNSVNDSKEPETMVETDAYESVIDTNQVQVDVYEQISVPEVETVSAQPEEIIDNVNMQQEEMQVQEVVEQAELVNMQYEEVGIPQVEEIITTQSVETEIQSVPVETIVHETILMQQDEMNPEQYEKMETVTMNNNEASNHLVQTETVQYVTDMGENYATNIAQGEIITEMPGEIVTLVTESV